MMAVLTLIILVHTFFLLIIIWLKRRYTFFKRANFMYERPSLLYGNLHYGLHVVEIYQNLYKKYSKQVPAFGFYMGINPGVVVTDLDVIKDVLINDFDNFNNRGVFFNKESDPLSAHIMSLGNNESKNLKEKLIPFFTSKKIKLIFRTLLNVSEYTIINLKLSQNLHMIDAKEVFSKYTIDMIGNVVYGIDMRALNNPNSKFREIGSELFDYKTFSWWKMTFLLYFQNLSKLLGLKLFPHKISSFFLGIVEATVKYRIENKIERNDFLDIYLKIKNEENDNNKEISIHEIAAQCFVFFYFGFETVSCTGAFTLYSLAINPKIQKKLRDEIKSVLSKYNNKISYEAVDDMKYLEMIINESLRMYSPIYSILRKSLNEYRISNSNLVIPKETFVIIPIYSIHRDSKYYPDPEKFDPERFSDEEKIKRHPMAYIPFGSGNRECFGTQFGLIQIKIMLIQLLENFRIIPNDKTAKVIKLNSKKPSLESLSGLWMTFERI